MYIEPVSTEIVCQVSQEDPRQILQEHFHLVYFLLAENQLVPKAAFEIVDGGIQRCLSGIPGPFFNPVFGCPSDSWDARIEEQCSYFAEAKVPFVWYVDEESSPEFKKKLLDHGFQDGGILQGVIGFLDKPIPSPEIPDDCVLELVEDEAAMEEFTEVVCSVFNYQGASREMYKKFWWDTTKNPQYTLLHWIARKDGKAVSALSTLIDKDVVSFWNGASLPEIRRHGFNTALRRLALRDAVSRGCRIGISYLMAEAMAFGICSKLGYQPEWRFNVFVSPNNETH
jgi:hypothetical protein